MNTKLLWLPWQQVEKPVEEWSWLKKKIRSFGLERQIAMCYLNPASSFVKEGHLDINVPAAIA